MPASLAYTTTHDSNPSPFLLSPILNLPPSFGSAYVGETFSCTLCANHETAVEPPPSTGSNPENALAPPPAPPPQQKYIRDVRIEAEMKTPSVPAGAKLDLTPPDDEGAAGGVDLDAGQTLQRIVNFDLKDEGNHVLGVTVSYYEATATSGRTRTFRKLYQFVCKPSLIVRTKAGLLLPPSTAQQQPTPPPEEEAEGGEKARAGRRRWVLEAQLENCSEDTMELERVGLELEDGLGCRGWNWDETGGGGEGVRPVLHPAEVEQVCFVIEEQEGKTAREEDGRIVFGVLGIGWRGEMGSRGYLATNKLGTRHVG